MIGQIGLMLDKKVALHAYEAAMIEARTKGKSRKDACMYAKEVMYQKFPSLRMNGRIDGTNKEYQSVMGSISKIADRYYPRNPESAPARETVVDNSTNNQFMEKMRNAAKTGFIPSAEYLAPFVGDLKARQITSYISFLRKEGWECEKNGKGFICKKIETEKERKIRELKEQLEEISGELRKLSAS